MILYYLYLIKKKNNIWNKYICLCYIILLSSKGLMNPSYFIFNFNFQTIYLLIVIQIMSTNIFKNDVINSNYIFIYSTPSFPLHIFRHVTFARHNNYPTHLLPSSIATSLSTKPYEENDPISRWYQRIWIRENFTNSAGEVINMLINLVM